MVPRGLLVLTLACLLTGCADAPRTPIQPDPAVNSLAVESVSAFIVSADYRVYSVRIRLRETSGRPLTISRIDLQFLGDGLDVTRTFSNIPKHSVSINASVELDDLEVADQPHQLDSAKSIIATVVYKTPAGETGAAIGGASVPTCTFRFDIGGPALIAVGDSTRMSGRFDTCPAMSYPLDGSQIRWRSLDPTIASVNSVGVVTGLANGLATIQGEYRGVVSSHKVTINVGPLITDWHRRDTNITAPDMGTLLILAVRRGRA